MDYVEHERQLAGLAASVADRLVEGQRRFFTELLEAGEYGIALEMLADWLSEHECRVTANERAQAEHLAREIGNVDRVMGPLSSCPE